MSKKRRKAYFAGMIAEYLAMVYLFFKGYRILRYRYKCGGGEIDILAQKGEVLVAVEVKFRRDLSQALESVHNKNQRRIENALKHFLAQNPEYAGFSMRFDVISFAWPLRFAHLDNAFHARS